MVSVPLRVILKIVPLSLAPPTSIIPYKFPSVGLDQPRVEVITVRAAALGANVVKRGERAAGGDFEDRAVAVGSAGDRCSIQIPIGGLDQPRLGELAVRATTLRAKAVQCGERAAWGDFEDRPKAFGPALQRCPVEVAIGALD